MATDVTGMTRINHEKLIRFVSRSFEKLGVPESDAEIAANVLVASDLRGVDTHGVIRFNPHTWYVKWLERWRDDGQAEYSRRLGERFDCAA
jgi:LDH2 family malate/lactate/ureidoglycolate dehydrogenase